MYVVCFRISWLCFFTAVGNFSINGTLVIWFLMILLLSPAVYASPEPGAFPDISFKMFNNYISKNFHRDISLSTVLMIFFSLIENPDLLNLHARQKIKVLDGEKNIQATGWLKCLSQALYERTEKQHAEDTLFTSSDLLQYTSGDKRITPLTMKLDELAVVLNLIPKEKKAPKSKLIPISQKQIQPVLVICPRSTICEDMTCSARSLVQGTKLSDIPKVTLIKGTMIYKNVPLLTGQCPKCSTLYSADHERVEQNTNTTHKEYTSVYLNSALYLKVGQTLWVDCEFSNAVLNGMYSFHASSSAYVEFWNNSFGNRDDKNKYQITRRQVWQSFVQESVRTIASSIDPNNNLELDDKLNISEVPGQAFHYLGQSGRIHPASGHSCAECTHKYKKTADVLPPNNEPQNIASTSQETDSDAAPVTMVVIDGIVMGPTVSVFDKQIDFIIKLKFISSIAHMTTVK